MSIVQTTYPNFHEALVAGQVADTVNCDIDSMLNLSATPIEFGWGVGIRVPPRGVEPGAARKLIARLNASVNDSATAVNVDSEGNPFPTLPAGQHYIIDDEIVYVTATSPTAITAMARGQLGSTAAGHTDNATVLSLLAETSFRGVAIQDERLPAASGTAYQEGDPVSVMWRGDVGVLVTAAVSVGDAATITLVAGTNDPIGAWSARPPTRDHGFVAGAHFLRDAASGALSVLRLTGQHHSIPSI